MMASLISLDVDDKKLLDISKDRQLSLSLEEMKVIQSYYERLGRSATDVELETFAQSWSEHCVHKTFRGDVEVNGNVFSNLLKSTIAKVTEELALPWCFSVFEDNAGIVDFEGDYAIAFKVETHNHPSALEPFGGAATGVGGVIRDILGVWGEPIANTDVLCFGPLDYPYEKLPRDMKHPSFIFKYVTAGIGHYGNNMGIPTVNGSIYFDESYVGNPLVYCGTVGLVKKSRYQRDARPGDAIILAGGRTGRDGIHGVTFASVELTTSQDTSVVQIGDPIEEEKLKRAILNIRDKGLGTAITDLGGGGLSSAVGEMANRAKCGAIVHLDRVPLKHPGMEPWEIWTSESQERMLL
ncbi:MAG: AIR synthase-related protein, partial [Candidatus Hydrothermarchaeales archaeon]